MRKRDKRRVEFGGNSSSGRLTIARAVDGRGRGDDVESVLVGVSRLVAAITQAHAPRLSMIALWH